MNRDSEASNIYSTNQLPAGAETVLPAGLTYNEASVSENAQKRKAALSTARKRAAVVAATQAAAGRAGRGVALLALGFGLWFVYRDYAASATTGALSSYFFTKLLATLLFSYMFYMFSRTVDGSEERKLAAAVLRLKQAEGHDD